MKPFHIRTLPTILAMLWSLADTNSIKIQSFENNPGLFLENLDYVRIFSHYGKITTTIRTSYIKEFLQNVTNRLADVKLQARIKEIFNVSTLYRPINFINPTEDFNLTKILQEPSPKSTTKNFSYNSEKSLLFVKNTIEIRLAHLSNQLNREPITAENIGELHAFFQTLKYIISSVHNHNIPHLLFSPSHLTEATLFIARETEYHLPELEDEFGSIECQMAQIRSAFIKNELFIEITVPFYRDTVKMYRLHSMPTFYELNDNFIKNEIIIPSNYIATDVKDGSPRLFLQEYDPALLKNCGKQLFLIRTSKSHQEFPCLEDVARRRTVKGCKTRNSVSNEAKFSETRNGLIYSIPSPIKINVTCHGLNYEQSLNSLVGILGLTDSCKVKLNGTIFYGHRDSKEIVYANDYLGVGNISNFLPVTPNPPKFNQYSPNPTSSTQSPLKLTRETLEIFQRNLDIVTTAGAVAMVALIVLGIFIFRVANFWEKYQKENQENTYRSLNADFTTDMEGQEGPSGSGVQIVWKRDLNGTLI